ncbi:NAD(P)/FAD-dependent oxidoreductase [Edaphobacter aggregans]|uniref:NAD(P)/FAD-dependent oxidoreductase n=1 Tax=Edaphobacter aggregans TaxID=570835 RepID=UPI0005547411|nr:FAD-dependent oxidoreductase [Edaphobacter aggregans]
MTQSNEQNPNRVKRVLIVGGGFAGLNCARKLSANPHVRITLLDKNNYQQFQPLLYQVATAILGPGNIAFSLRGTLRSHPNVDVKMAEVVSIDLNARTVETAQGQHYEGDFLVLAAGSHTQGTSEARNYIGPDRRRDKNRERSRSTTSRSVSSRWRVVAQRLRHRLSVDVFPSRLQGRWQPFTSASDHSPRALTTVELSDEKSVSPDLSNRIA